MNIIGYHRNSDFKNGLLGYEKISIKTIHDFYLFDYNLEDIEISLRGNFIIIFVKDTMQLIEINLNHIVFIRKIPFESAVEKRKNERLNS